MSNFTKNDFYIVSWIIWMSIKQLFQRNWKSMFLCIFFAYLMSYAYVSIMHSELEHKAEAAHCTKLFAVLDKDLTDAREAEVSGDQETAMLLRNRAKIIENECNPSYNP